MSGPTGPEIHLEGALIAQRLGRRHSAHYALLEALAGDPKGELLGRIRFVHATALREIGNFDGAIAAFTSWLADLGQYSGLEAKYLGAAHYNLGLALRQAEHYADSLRHYQLACDEFRRRDQPTYLAMSLYNLAWAACLSGRSDIAEAALHDAEPHSSVAPFTWHHRLTGAFVQAVSENGDLHRVMELCRDIIEGPATDVPPSVRSHAYWLSGRVALALELLDTAQYMVEQALLHGARAGDANRCLSDAEQLLLEIRDRQRVDQEIPPPAPSIE